MFHHLIVFAPVDAAGARLASVSELSAHGVDLFFALSGFLITAKLAEGLGNSAFSTAFWVRRFAKIVPLYFSVLLVVFVLLKPALIWSGHAEKLSWLNNSQGNWPWYGGFCSNLRNAIDGRFTNPAIDVSWSLAIEVQFYLLSYVVARWVAPKMWPTVVVVTIIASFAFRTIAISLGANWIQILTLTPGRLDAFAFGAAVLLFPRAFVRLPIGLVFGLPLVCAVLWGWSREHVAVELVGYTFIAFASAVFISQAIAPNHRSVFNRVTSSVPLRFMGKISYSVYLIHLPVRAVLRDSFIHGNRSLATGTDWASQLAFVAAGGAICIGGGWVTWRVLEEPLRRQIVRHYSRRSGQASATAT